MHRRGTQIGALHTLTRRCQTYRLCSWAASFATPKDGDSAHGGHAPPHEAQWQSQPQQPSRLPCSAIHAMWGLIAVISAAGVVVLKISRGSGDSHGGQAPPQSAQWQSQPQQPSRLPCSAIHAMWGLIAVINDKVAFGDAIGTAIETAKRAQRKRRRCMRKVVVRTPLVVLFVFCLSLSTSSH
jgi:hypothetical protein